MSKKSDAFFVRLLQISSIFIWVFILWIANLIIKAQPEGKTFFDYLFKLKPRSYLDIDLIHQAMLSSFVLLFISILLIFVNANFHKRKLVPVSFTIIFSSVFSLAIILYYILIF